MRDSPNSLILSARETTILDHSVKENTMNAKDFLLALDEMLELAPGTLTGAETLESLDDWDSLAVISFIALVDEKLNLVVEGAKLAEARTVADLLAVAGVAP